jgi:dTDP-glucose pyrophosphorylase
MRRADGETQLDAHQQAAADSGVKAMIPIGRPFLDYVLSALADAGYRRVCLVVAPDHSVLATYYTEQVTLRRIELSFAVQETPRGTADAVAAAEAFAGDDPFLVINSDNYYPPDALAALRRQDGPAVALFEPESLVAGGNIPAERIRNFSVGRFDPQGNLAGILEKPDEATLAGLPRPLWVSMNCWRFGPSIFRACRAIPLSPRGELELPTAVQYAIDSLGETFRVVEVRAPVLDLTSRKDIAAVAEKLAGLEVSL